MSRFTHVLVPTDFSEPSRRALEIAAAIAQSFDAKLTLLHVWSLLFTPYTEGMSWPIEEMERGATKALATALAEAKLLYPKTDSVLRSGGESEGILEVIKEQGIDLVVMGTHGRRGLPRLLIGSVAEKVVRFSPVPVMTVAAKHEVKR